MGKSAARLIRQGSQELQWQIMKPELDRYLALHEIAQLKDPAQLPRYLTNPNQDVRDEAARKLHEITEPSSNGKTA